MDQSLRFLVARRGKGGKRRNGPSSIERLMVKTARALGIASKAKKTTEGVGRCLDHAFLALSFENAWQLATFLDSLAERRPRRKKPQRVHLPAWKVPADVRAVVAVRCTSCSGTGRGCAVCTGYGWGVVFRIPIKTRACAKHEAA